jgi:hypothetical protein
MPYRATVTTEPTGRPRARAPCYLYYFEINQKYGQKIVLSTPRLHLHINDLNPSHATNNPCPAQCQHPPTQTKIRKHEGGL